MAPTRKTAKRKGGKKRAGAKRASARKRTSSAKKRTSSAKRPSRKTASKRAGRRTTRTTTLKRRAKQGLQAARGGLETVREAGERTWEALRSTTSQVVEGVKDRLSEDSRSDNDDRSDRFPR
jgi:hypothetical protein